jgi:hypothetical protein
MLEFLVFFKFRVATVIFGSVYNSAELVAQFTSELVPKSFGCTTYPLLGNRLIQKSI